jgi:hypothetical protein
MEISEIRHLLSDSRTWFTFGIAAILLVWSFKMDMTTSNLTLIGGIVTFALGVLLQPWVTSQPVIVRFFFVNATISLLALAAYFMGLWTGRYALELYATAYASDKPSGTVIANIPWSSKYTDVHLIVMNPSRETYRELELFASCDQLITRAGEVTGIALTTIVPREVPKLTMESVNIPTNRRASIPLVLVATQKGYVIRCDVLPRKSHIDVVFAAVTMTAPNQGSNEKGHWRDKDYYIYLSEAGEAGKPSYYFGKEDHTEDIFGDRPAVEEVIVEGHFTAGKSENKVSQTIKTDDPVARSIPEVIKAMQSSSPR